jgi:site-specific DNA recombinase
MERKRARQRTHDALVRKARAGHVPGGSLFGYDNVEVTLPDPLTGRPKRLHVERRITETEAAVVRQIFELVAAGWGTRRITHELNARRVPAPPPRRAGRPRAWAPSTIYAMLTRPLYHDEVTWNRSRKRNAWDIKQQLSRPEQDWVRLKAPQPAHRPRAPLAGRSRALSRPPGRPIFGRRTVSFGGARRTGSSHATCSRGSPSVACAGGA